MKRFPRVRLFAFCITVMFAIAATWLCFTKEAAAEMSAHPSPQAPGFFRMQLGDFVVTALYDGYNLLATSRMSGMPDAEIQSHLHDSFLDSAQGVQTAVNAYLVQSAAHLLLIDAGGGSCYSHSLGHVIDNLRAAGYAPSQVTAVLLTHLHSDHVCGIIDAAGKPVFNNATLYVARAEADYWLDPQIAANAPEARKRTFSFAQKALAPYQQAGRLVRFDPTTPLPAQLGIEPLHGHTPGHTGYLLSSGGSSLLVWGDVIHSHAVQFAHPEVSFDFDFDRIQALATRQRILAQAAQQRLWVAGAHLPFPGIGHVRQEGAAYRWVPIEYGPLRADR